LAERWQVKFFFATIETKEQELSMTEFNFVENAQAIFDKAVSATPLPFRGTVKKGMIKILENTYGDNEEITEAKMIDVITENTPKAFLGLGLSAVRPLITDPKLADV
jgi:hypothetical protein